MLEQAFAYPFVLGTCLFGLLWGTINVLMVIQSRSPMVSNCLVDQKG
jgi:hypothetical protein